MLSVAYGLSCIGVWYGLDLMGGAIYGCDGLVFGRWRFLGNG